MFDTCAIPSPLLMGLKKMIERCKCLHLILVRDMKATAMAESIFLSCCSVQESALAPYVAIGAMIVLTTVTAYTGGNFSLDSDCIHLLIFSQI
jgi:hypothetical protein